MSEGDRIVSPAEVLGFWFEELSDRDWYNSTPALDQQIRRRFRTTHLALARSVDPVWRADPASRLAAVSASLNDPRNLCGLPAFASFPPVVSLRSMAID